MSLRTLEVDHELSKLPIRGPLALCPVLGAGLSRLYRLPRPTIPLHPPCPDTLARGPHNANRALSRFSHGQAADRLPPLANEPAGRLGGYPGQVLAGSEKAPRADPEARLEYLDASIYDKIMKRNDNTWACPTCGYDGLWGSVPPPYSFSDECAMRVVDRIMGDPISDPSRAFSLYFNAFGWTATFTISTPGHERQYIGNAKTAAWAICEAAEKIALEQL